MIDADPQCNTTQFFNAADEKDLVLKVKSEQEIRIAHSQRRLSGKGDGKMEYIEGDEVNPTLKAIDMSCYVGSLVETPLRKIMHRGCDGMITDGEIDDILKDEESFVKCNEDAYDDMLWLLAGSPKIDESVPQLTAAFKSNELTPREIRIVGFFSYVMRKCSEFHGFDVFIIDMGNSALNTASVSETSTELSTLDK